MGHPVFKAFRVTILSQSAVAPPLNVRDSDAEKSPVPPVMSVMYSTPLAALMPVTTVATVAAVKAVTVSKGEAET